MGKEGGRKTNKLAITSFVCGIICFLIVGSITFLSLTGSSNLGFFGALISFVLSILSIVFGIIAVVQIYKSPQSKGRWFAIIGIILGLVFWFYVFWNTFSSPNASLP